LSGSVLVSFPTRRAAEQALTRFNQIHPNCQFGFGRLRLIHEVSVRLMVHPQIFVAMRDVIARTALALQEQLRCEVLQWLVVRLAVSFFEPFFLS
jgi:hypothetical protein